MVEKYSGVSTRAQNGRAAASSLDLADALFKQVSGVQELMRKRVEPAAKKLLSATHGHRDASNVRSRLLKAEDLISEAKEILSNMEGFD